MARKGQSVDGFFGVDSGSTLVVSVGPNDGTVYAGALWYRTGNVADVWVPDRDLVPGPWSAELVGRTIYVLEVEIRLLVTATPVITCAVVDAGGNVVDAIQWEWDGATPGSRNIKLYVITKA